MSKERHVLHELVLGTAGSSTT